MHICHGTAALLIYVRTLHLKSTFAIYIETKAVYILVCNTSPQAGNLFPVCGGTIVAAELYKAKDDKCQMQIP